MLIYMVRINSNDRPKSLTLFSQLDELFHTQKDHAKELPVANTNGRRNVPLQVVEAGSSAVPSANGVIRKKKAIYLTDIEKARNWDGSSIAKIVREHLYPLAKIIFNSKEELQYGGHICNVIMKHISRDPEYERKTEEEKTNHKKEMWALWSGIVSKNLDTKRHNQKTMLRKAFYGTYQDGKRHPRGQSFALELTAFSNEMDTIQIGSTRHMPRDRSSPRAINY